jgi:hypothetical protein
LRSARSRRYRYVVEFGIRSFMEAVGGETVVGVSRERKDGRGLGSEKIAS